MKSITLILGISIIFCLNSCSQDFKKLSDYYYPLFFYKPCFTSSRAKKTDQVSGADKTEKCECDTEKINYKAVNQCESGVASSK